MPPRPNHPFRGSIMTSSPASTWVDSLARGARWGHKSLELVGLSLSGTRISVSLPEQKLCFDLALGLPYAMHMRHFLITHGHRDHAGGIPYVISQRNVTDQPPPVFYMPHALVPPLREVI